MSRSLQASPSGIERAKRALVRKSLTQKAIANQLSIASWATVNKFFTGKPVDRFIFIEICDALDLGWEDIVSSEAKPEINPNQPSSQLNVSLIHFSVYDPEWVGREQLVAELNHWVNHSCRILLLVGLTGIGKTALAEKLIETLRGNWIEDRENFELQEQALDFASTALKWLQRWGETVPIDQRQPQQLRQQLLKRLSQYPHLILLDSLETLLTGNEEEGWGGFADGEWTTFFASLLAESSCPSRLILTSQDLPAQFESAAFDRHKNLWFCYPLKGLDPEEQIELFQKVGLGRDLESPDHPLRLIGEVYDGHPLALRVIAGEIKKDYGSSIKAYWKEHHHYVEEVKQDLDEARQQGLTEGVADRWQLASYTKTLRQKVKERVEKSFERLRADIPDAYLLLCTASVYRCEVQASWWLTHLEYRGYDTTQQRNALQALRDRYLIEDCGVDQDDERLVAQHNLIRSVAIVHRLKLLPN